MHVDTTRFHVNIGDSIELRCIAMGYPEVTFEWLFTYKNEQINLKSSQRKGDMFLVSRKRVQYHDGKSLSTSVLRINNVEQKHWGKYKCQAENKIGYADVQFIVEGYSKFIASFFNTAFPMMGLIYSNLASFSFNFSPWEQFALV